MCRETWRCRRVCIYKSCRKPSIRFDLPLTRSYMYIFIFIFFFLILTRTHARTYASFLFLDTLYSVQLLFDHVFFFYRNPTKVRVDLDRLRNSPRKRRSKGFSFQRYKIYKRRSRAVVRELASPRPMAVTVIDATRSMLNEISSYRSRLTRESNLFFSLLYSYVRQIPLAVIPS